MRKRGTGQLETKFATSEPWGQLQMRALSVIAGILAALYGAWQILLVFAFSTMVGQDLPDAARDAEQARAVSDGIPEIGFGVVLIIVGIWLVFSKPRSRAAAAPARRESRKR